GQEISLPETSASLRTAAQHLRRAQEERASDSSRVERATKAPWMRDGRPRLFVHGRLLADSERLRRVARALDVSVIDGLLSAYCTATASWSGGLPVLLVHHGRSLESGRVDLSRIAAPLLTTLPIPPPAGSPDAKDRVLYTQRARMMTTQRGEQIFR